MLRVHTLISLCILLGSCTGSDPSAYLSLAERYQVTVHRDTWGVPHVYGHTDPDVAFGFAYAQAEDNWLTIQEGIPFYRGTLASYNGPDAAITDYLVDLLGIWPTIEQQMDDSLPADVIAYVQAFADGLNYYAARHPEALTKDILPITVGDIVAAHMLRHLFFYGFEAAIGELTGPERARPISQANSVSLSGLPIGSNAIAASPAATSDGATRIAINSHQPTTGPVAWYEAHLRSDTGLNVMGGVFPGSPSISLGFTEEVAWAATVNKPDLVDVYVLELNPDNDMQYRLDGEWHELESGSAKIRVLLWGFLPWTVSRETLHSVHGPVLRTDHGTYAVRYAGMGELRQVTQWYEMNRAHSLADWLEAMRLHSFASFNFVAADKTGAIYFVHNSLTPIRKPGFDWSQYLPGNDSSLIWDQTVPFDALPQVINPPSGYLMSANQSPFRVSAPGDNPDPSSFPAEAGYPSRMTNRAHRGLELLESLKPISEEEFFAIKHDKYYSRTSRSYEYVSQIFDIDYAQDDSLAAAQNVLRTWDLGTDVDNRGAALGVCLLSGEWSAEQRGGEPPAVREEFERCVGLLQTHYSRPDPRWGDVNRHIRGTVNVPIGGGPDTLRAIYGTGLEDQGYLTNVAGDGLYYLVSWDSAGAQTVRGIHHFGSATLDERSPHFADQAVPFALESLKDPFFDHGALMENLERSYRP